MDSDVRLLEILQYPFMQRAFFIGAIAAIPFGLIGTFVVVRRIGYLAGAIAHCAFGGIGIGIYLQYAVASGTSMAFAGRFLDHFGLQKLVDPIIVSVLVAIASALLIGAVRIRTKEREDTIIGAIWTIGMALGWLLLELTPGSANISNFLFGNILLITPTDVYLVAGLSILVFLIVLVFFKRFEAICFDEEFARLRGMPTECYFQLLLVLAALTVVLLVRVVGILLVIAMLTLPAATACRLAERLLPICFLSILVGFASIWFGLFLSAWAHLASGPTIALVAAAFYLLSIGIVRKSS